jgi:acyl-CoA synthetase (AMP-forming)/AMP-acid ligase II
MFISGGENVYPAEIERVLRKHPAVEDIAVVGVPDKSWGEVGCAFVIAKPGADLKSEDLIDYCDGQLARYKWPQKILIGEDFPRTALGKVRKTVLRQNYLGEDKW